VISHIQKCFFFLSTISFLLVSNLAAITSERPKIGLVLSGGGARGFAHIGTLKMLDSLEIPIDYIAGTSMGGIIGALYAVGYSGNEIEAIVKKTDWNEIFTDHPPRNELPFFQKKDLGKYQLELGMEGMHVKPPSGLIFGQKISLLFSSLTFPYERITDFKQLPIPFHCVAVNIETGDEVILKNGSLAKAMRATMAIPSVFSPVEWGDSLLVDGGMVNNMPVDVVKAMGADLVIAVNVSAPLMKRENLNSAIAVLEQSIAMLGIDRWQENRRQTDIYIQPELFEHGSADFEKRKVAAIIQHGNRAANAAIFQLKSFKKKYKLVRMTDTDKYTNFSELPIIYDVQIIGYQSISFQTLYDQLNIKPGDLFDCPALERRLDDIKSLHNLENVKYEVIPLSEKNIKLIIRIKEKDKPIIHGISIFGNEKLPFIYIYQLLGLEPSDVLDTDDLNRRIMTAYGLGYFESIRYEIESRGNNQVHLIIHVKEHEKRKLRLGFRYNTHYKLVALVSVQGTNFLIPGLRYEHELQFAGLTHYLFKTYYPSRTLNLPIYPYMEFETKDVPVSVFDLYNGKQIFKYKTKSLRYTAGLGMLLGKSLNFEVGYEIEHMDVTPKVAFGDPSTYPSWDEKLRKLSASLVIDRLDDLSTPNKGIYISARYEGSYKQFNSEWPYELFKISADVYHTLKDRHTFRFYGFSGSGKSLPIYKTPNQGHPTTFVGMQYDQLFGNTISVIRTDYRFRMYSNVYLKLIYNRAFNLTQETQFYKVTPDHVQGLGVGLKIVTPIGPIELIVSRGNKHFGTTSEMQNVFYFMFGSTVDKFLFQ